MSFLLGRHALGRGAIGLILDSGGSGASSARNSLTYFTAEESVLVAPEKAAALGFLRRLDWDFELIEKEKLILPLISEDQGEENLQLGNLIRE